MNISALTSQSGSKNCIGESNASAKHLNNPERIAELNEHFDKKDRDAKLLADKQQAKHTRDRFLQYFLFSKCKGYMTKPTEKLTLAHIDAFMTSQKLRFPEEGLFQFTIDLTMIGLGHVDSNGAVRSTIGLG